MESYQKRKIFLEEKYGQLIQVFFVNDEVLKKTQRKIC